MVVHLSTGACEALKRAAITDPAYSGRRFRGRTVIRGPGTVGDDRRRIAGQGAKTGGRQSGRLSHPAAVPPKEAAAEEGIRRGRQSGLSHPTSFSPVGCSRIGQRPPILGRPGFLKESGILAPGLIFACRTRLQAFGAGLLSLKIRTPRRDKSDRFVPPGGFFICCIIRTDRQTSCLRHRPAEWERRWAASWGAARWFPHR